MMGTKRRVHTKQQAARRKPKRKKSTILPMPIRELCGAGPGSLLWHRSAAVRVLERARTAPVERIPQLLDPHLRI